MALTDDQRAMLRLLAQNEEGYEDIAALKGISVEQVKAEVREALAAAAAEEESAPPAQVEKAAAEPPAEPAAPPAAEPQVRRRKPAAPRRSIPRPSRPPVPADRRRLMVIAAGAIGVVAVVLTAIAVFGGDSDSGSEEAAGAGQIAAPSSGKQPTQAVLAAVDGSDASGQALFGRVKNQVVLAIAAKGLEPSGQGESYAVSLVRSPSVRVPIAAAKVGKSGELGGQYPVAPNVLGLLANGFDQMEVSLVVNEELRAALTKAQGDGDTPSFDGTDVLRGEITGPVVK